MIMRRDRRSHNDHDHEKDHLGHNECHEAVEDGVQDNQERAVEETEFVTLKRKLYVSLEILSFLCKI